MFKRTVQQRRIQHSPDSEGEEPAPKRQKLEPVEAEPMEQGRPYQAFVENEASRFRQELTQSGSQAEPAPVEIRTRSTSEPAPNFLDRTVGKSHYAVAGQAQHGLEIYLRTPALSVASACPSRIDTLSRQVKDARWVSRDFLMEDLMELMDQ